MKTIHDNIKKHFLSLEIIESVSEVIELPNKYGNNVSYFNLKYHYKDKYNYNTINFNIDWDKKVLFISDEGYFRFENQDDIIKKVSIYLK